MRCLRESGGEGRAFAAPKRLRRAGGVRCWLFSGDPEFKPLEKEIKINWLK